ncbi:MAG: hypothetical protein ACMUHM_05820 [Thermoplasmatota archaeon]
MGEWNYNPQKDQRTDEPQNKITKLPTFHVYLPYREQVAWPNRCVMCEAPATKTGTISQNFKSGNYIVTKTRTTMSFKNVPYCAKCHRRHNFTPVQLIVIFLGPLLGLAAAGIFGTLLDLPVCYACSIWIFVAIIFALVGVFFVGGGMGSPPVQFEVQTEGNQIGKNRPTGLKFSFRNWKYSEDFRELNMPKQERYDLW